MFRPKCLRPVLLLALGSALTWVTFVCTANAQDSNRDSAEGGQGSFLVRVPLPITGSVDERVRRQVRHMISAPREFSQGRPTIVLEFWSPEEERPATGSEFERSLALARFLTSTELSRYRTMAYLPRSVVGHAVLPVLACEEIVMAQGVEFGSAGQGEPSLSQIVKDAYADVADRRRTVPVPVAMGMLDSSLTVQRVKTAAGFQYATGEDLQRIREEHNVLAIEELAGPGDFVSLTGDARGREFGFVGQLANNRRELATLIGVPADELAPDPSAGEEWRAIRVDLMGPVNRTSIKRVMRSVEEHVQSDINFICLWIDSPGGSPQLSLELASFLAEQDATRVRTVAYVSKQALSDAAIVALACDQIVMKADAKLGGDGAYQPNEKQIADMRIPLKRVCESKSKSWSLPAAIIDPALEVFRCNLQGTEVEGYFSEEELASFEEANRWKRGDAVTKPDKTLQMNGTLAEQLGIAQHVVRDYDEFKQLYDLSNDPDLVQPSWADDFIEFLAQPHVAGTLLFFGGFALMAELSSPGIGLGAFISSVCFVIFFWAQFLHGTANWLEILLFLLGLAFIALEMFVVPGFGVCGIGGFALVLASLILASQTFVIPRNEYQLDQFPRSLLTVIGAGGGIMVGLFLLRKYFHRAPFFNRIMLQPPEGDALLELDRRESVANYDDYLGQIGTTMTPLVPSGKAMLGDRLLDVMSEGELIEKGVRVKVSQVQGNRILVSCVDG